MSPKNSQAIRDHARATLRDHGIPSDRVRIERLDGKSSRRFESLSPSGPTLFEFGRNCSGELNGWIAFLTGIRRAFEVEFLEDGAAVLVVYSTPYRPRDRRPSVLHPVPDVSLFP